MAKGGIIPLILGGGAGRRLSPLSTPEKPKQFLPLGLSGAPLLLETAERVQSCADMSLKDIHIITLGKYEKAVRGLLPHCPLLLEQTARNTAPAIALAVQTLRQTYDDETALWICPSDHVIEKPAILKHRLKEALSAAQNGLIVTFGIPPTRAETGYGYIKAAPDGRIITFTEKPDLQTAQIYLQNGYLWNSGMFVATLKTLQDELDRHAPALLTSEQSIPFDKAVMEKTEKGVLIPCPDMGWNDVGIHKDLLETAQFS